MALVSLNSQTFAGARDRTRSVLSSFTLGQKVVTVLALAGFVVGGVVFMHVESRPNYQPLFTNLQSSDAGAITAQLATANVPYQFTNGGSTVLVPANDVNQERVALAEQGLPGSGHGRILRPRKERHHDLGVRPAGGVPAGPRRAARTDH